MKKIGTQSGLSLNRMFHIAMQGIHIRLSRSMVTGLGVILGIAFVMTNLATQLVKDAVAEKMKIAQSVDMMISLLNSEIGSAEGKSIAVAVVGEASKTEIALLDEVLRRSPAEVRASGFRSGQVTPVDLGVVGNGSCVLLVLGNGKTCDVSVSDMTSGMTNKIILDSLSDRRFADGVGNDVRRELFFGEHTAEQKAELERAQAASFSRTVWIMVISLLVTVIGISNAMLMSVTERFREIGTMKCLGALSGSIRILFLIESCVIGLLGSLVGAAGGAVLPVIIYGFVYGFGDVLGSLTYLGLFRAGIASVAIGTVLAVLAAVYPAGIASRMVPAAALRSTV